MPDEPTITIALVDDDPIVRSALGTYLSTASGMEIVHRCSDGQEALDAITSRPVDVVITDVRMPRMDGIETTTELRRRFPDIRILVITSFDEVVTSIFLAGPDMTEWSRSGIICRWTTWPTAS